MTAQAIKADIAVLAQLEDKAMRKGLFAAFGAYRRERNRLEALLTEATR